MAGKAAHIAGVVARGNTADDPARRARARPLARLAMPFFCAVPLGTPLDPKGVRVIPSAGPYYVASYTPGQGVVLERNPNYRAAARTASTGSSYRRRLEAEEPSPQIEAGTADYASTASIAATPRGSQRATAREPGCAEGQATVLRQPELGLDFLVLNTHRPLFRDVRLRQAVNYAIDRRALARIGSACDVAELPTDQYLPPGMPGFRDVQHLSVHAGSRRGEAAGRQATANRRPLHLQQSPCDQTRADREDEPGRDRDRRRRSRRSRSRHCSPASAGMASRSISRSAAGLPTTPIPPNFLEPPRSRAGDAPDVRRSGLQAQARGSGAALGTAPLPGLRRARRRLGPKRGAVGRLSATSLSHDFFSARMGCQVYQPVYGMDLAALCIRKKS